MDNKFLKKYGDWCLITGASSGIGRALSKEAAKRGLNLILIARREHLLNELKEEIEENYQVDVKIIVLDLIKPGSIESLLKATENLNIGLLIPCAGIETAGDFVKTEVSVNQAILKLNIEVPMLLASHFGNKMANNRKGGILFISSLFGYQGIPYVAHYSATKAYILSLGEALSVELGAFGVDVTVSSPGLTKTEMPEKMPINFKKLPMMLPLTPEKVASISIKALGKKQTVVTGFINKIFAWSNRFMPRSFPVILFGYLIKRAFKKELKSSVLIDG